MPPLAKPEWKSVVVFLLQALLMSPQWRHVPRISGHRSALYVGGAWMVLTVGEKDLQGGEARLRHHCIRAKLEGKEWPSRDSKAFNQIRTQQLQVEHRPFLTRARLQARCSRGGSQPSRWAHGPWWTGAERQLKKLPRLPTRRQHTHPVVVPNLPANRART